MVETHRVEFVDLGQSIDVPENRSILEAAEEAGIDLPYRCRMGVCGVCCALRDGDGDVEQTEGMFLSEAEKTEGYVLTCIGRPRSDLELESDNSP